MTCNDFIFEINQTTIIQDVSKNDKLFFHLSQFYSLILHVKKMFGSSQLPDLLMNWENYFACLLPGFYQIGMIDYFKTCIYSPCFKLNIQTKK